MKPLYLTNLLQKISVSSCQPLLQTGRDKLQLVSRKFSLFFLFLISVVIAGCGFHLRGFGAVPPQLKILYLESSVPYDPVMVDLRNDLRSMGVVMVPNQKLAPVTLQIIRLSFNQQVANISASTIVRTYVLIYIMTFQLTDRDGKVIYGPATITAQTTYSTSDNQLLGDDQVIQQLKEQLQRELLMKLFTHINSESGRSAINRISVTNNLNR